MKSTVLLTLLALLSTSANSTICLVYYPTKSCELNSTSEIQEKQKSPCNSDCNEAKIRCSLAKEEFEKNNKCFMSNSAIGRAIAINIEESIKSDGCFKTRDCNSPLKDYKRNCVRCIPFQLEGLTFTSFKPETHTGLIADITINSPIQPKDIIYNTILDFNKNIQPFIIYTILRC